VNRDRPRPMYNGELYRFGNSLASKNQGLFNGDDVADIFKIEFHQWLISSNLNNFNGLDALDRRDIIQGVTSFIDDLYQMNPGNIYTISQDYMYHKRMFGDKFVLDDIKDIPPTGQLLFSMPFPFYGDIHPKTADILEFCNKNNIPVHIDAAWVGCTRMIEFNFDTPCIKSIGFSLSKGLGLGFSRIGVRYSRDKNVGPVSIMNDFTMIPRPLCGIGISFMRQFGHDYLQNKYGHHYKTLCEQCNLIPSKTIHLAHEIHNGVMHPVGTRQALRYLDEPNNPLQ